ncbi:type IV pilus assembly protein PilM [bacterium]|nr:type IV pilus assembly protein PilM [bacterium]
MFGFKRKQSPLIGIDINSDSITMAQLERTRNGIEAVRFASMPTPANTIREGLVTDPQTVGGVIMDLFVKAGIPASGPSPTINTTIPAQSAVIRLMPVPTGMPADELAEVVTQEATTHVPFPIADANLDWSIMPTTERTDPDGVRRVDVILAAVQRSIIESYWRTADSAGALLGKVEVSSLAAIRGLSIGGYESQDKVTMTVNLRHDATDINFIKNTMPLFGRSVIIGVETLTEAISRSLDMDYEEALELLPDIPLFGAPPRNERLGEAAQVARTIFSDITDELERSLEFFESQAGQVKLEEIVLTGPGCMLKGLDKFVQSRTGVNTVFGDPLKLVTYDSAIISPRLKPVITSLIGSSVDPSWNPGFTVDLDLNKDGRLPLVFDNKKTQVIEEKEEERSWFIPAVSASTLLFVASFLCYAYLAYFSVPNQTAEIEAYNGKIDAAKKELTEIAKMKDSNEALETRRKILRFLVHHSTKWSAYLQDLRERLPKGVQINHIVFEMRKVKVEGFAREFGDVSKLAVNMEDSKLTDSAVVDYATRKEKTPDMVSFGVTVNFHKEEIRDESRISQVPAPGGKQ